MIPTPSYVNQIYAPNATFKEQPDATAMAAGVKPLDSLPAEWWNWLWNSTTSKLSTMAADVTSIATELNNVVTHAGYTPDKTQCRQLTCSIQCMIDCGLVPLQEDVSKTLRYCCIGSNCSLVVTNCSACSTCAYCLLPGLVVGPAYASLQGGCPSACIWVNSATRVRGDLCLCNDLYIPCGALTACCGATISGALTVSCGADCLMLGSCSLASLLGDGVCAFTCTYCVPPSTTLCGRYFYVSPSSAACVYVELLSKPATVKLEARDASCVGALSLLSGQAVLQVQVQGQCPQSVLRLQPLLACLSTGAASLMLCGAVSSPQASWGIQCIQTQVSWDHSACVASCSFMLCIPTPVAGCCPHFCLYDTLSLSFGGQPNGYCWTRYAGQPKNSCGYCSVLCSYNQMLTYHYYTFAPLQRQLAWCIGSSFACLCVRCPYTICSAIVQICGSLCLRDQAIFSDSLSVACSMTLGSDLTVGCCLFVSGGACLGETLRAVTGCFTNALCVDAGSGPSFIATTASTLVCTDTFIVGCLDVCCATTICGFTQIQNCLEVWCDVRMVRCACIEEGLDVCCNLRIGCDLFAAMILCSALCCIQLTVDGANSTKVVVGMGSQLLCLQVGGMTASLTPGHITLLHCGNTACIDASATPGKWQLHGFVLCP